MKLNSRYITILALLIMFFTGFVLEPFFNKMETPQSFEISVYFVIAAFLFYLIFLQSKFFDKKQNKITILTLIITILILIVIFLYNRIIV